jgi:PhnB protein
LLHTFYDEAHAADIFNRLSAGGKIHVPFKKQFWGDWHGNFTDYFSIRWMINVQAAGIENEKNKNV